ncbi:hypothetical protein ACS0TY_005583 [Phlomoides rotata]
MDGINEIHVPRETCAACKHLRKRCEETCVFAPYFPPEKTAEFQIVHMIFGIRNTKNMISSVEENEREKTIETLILEAKIRLENPVHGCLAIERMLGAEIEKVFRELDEVKQQLKFFSEQNNVKN